MEKTISSRRLRHTLLLMLVFVIILSSCDGRGGDGAEMAFAREIKANDISNLEDVVVFFGHQSVGANILDGVSALLATVDTASVSVAEANDLATLRPGTVAHGHIGGNGDPGSKVADFAHAVDSRLGKPSPNGGADIALMKFCYVDVHGSRSPEELFEEYRATLSRLELDWPDTSFVHLTMPITSKHSAFGTRMKNLVKTVLNRGTVQPLDWNEYRHAYNELVRGEYGDTGRLFDLAMYEAAPYKSESPAVSAAGVPELQAEYTDDGAHLNELGARYIGGEFLLFLSQLSGSLKAERNGG